MAYHPLRQPLGRHPVDAAGFCAAGVVVVEQAIGDDGDGDGELLCRCSDRPVNRLVVAVVDDGDYDDGRKQRQQRRQRRRQRRLCRWC